MYLEDKHGEHVVNPYIFESTFITDEFELVLEDLNGDGTLEFFMPYFENNQWMNKCYSITGNEIIRMDSFDQMQ